jgi:hypothetical protein
MELLKILNAKNIGDWATRTEAQLQNLPITKVDYLQLTSIVANLGRLDLNLDDALQTRIAAIKTTLEGIVLDDCLDRRPIAPDVAPDPAVFQNPIVRPDPFKKGS